MNSRISAMVAAATLAIVGGTTRAARADGVTAYLPLNLEPEVERQIERVLILAEEPILKRPIAVNLVQLALPAACLRDRDLCNRVKKYLERYSRDYGVTHASVTGAIVNGARGTVPNEHGLPLQSPWDASAQAFVQPNDYFLASAGVVTNSGRTTPTGTVISMGFNWAQLDIGYRDHWFSPMTDSSMMIGTEAATMPSATISNYEPLGRLGFQYEFFVAQMSSSDHIAFLGQNVPGQQGRGHPKLAGGQFTIEPLSGWSLGVNQLLQYGGAGLKDSPNTLLHYFFKPSGLAQTLSNHQASYVSRFVFPARIPFAVYAQYAGEDNSNGGSYLLGNTATSIGIDFPLLGRNFDATYEVSEWQNFWYTNSIFLDGMINYGNVIGSWGGDQRIFNDGVGARSQMLRVGWTPPFGGYLEERVRTLINQNYGIYPYQHYLDVTVRYSRPWKDLTVGGEVLAGRDVFGKSFSRLSGFVRYGGSADARSYDSGDEESAEGTGEAALTELFVDAGGNANKVKVDLQKGLPITTSPLNYGPHVALGARRAIAENDDLGVRVEFDEVQKHSLIGFRPLDYRHRFGEHLALGLYAGVARYALGTPAYSIYGGVGAQWRDVLPKWDVGVDFRYAQNVARDHVLATDPPGVRADSFYKIESVIAVISRRF